MHQTVRNGPKDGNRIDRLRRDRVACMRRPRRLAIRLLCRASVLLAMACTGMTVGRAAGAMAIHLAPSAHVAQVAGPIATVAGYVVVATLAWATMFFLIENEELGTDWVETPRIALLADHRGVSRPDGVSITHPVYDLTGWSGQEACFWAILEKTHAVAYMKDHEGRYLRVNKRWANLFDPEGLGVVGKDDYAFFPKELADAFIENDRMVLEAGITVELEETAMHADGPHTYFSIKIPLFNLDGEPCGICGISSDITERKELERRLADQLELARAANEELERRWDELAEANARLAGLASTDGLTSLMNRRHFDEVIDAGMETAFRDGTPLSVLMLDLDGFKSYNDAFGHPAGDRVLQKVAAILRDHVRACDELARYGGEEFIAMMPETDEASSRVIAERLRAAIEAWRWPDRCLTASVGVATFTSGLGDSQALIDQADRALYRSKANGRNRVTHHTDIARVPSYSRALRG